MINRRSKFGYLRGLTDPSFDKSLFNPHRPCKCSGGVTRVEASALSFRTDLINALSSTIYPFNFQQNIAIAWLLALL